MTFTLELSMPGVRSPDRGDAVFNLVHRLQSDALLLRTFAAPSAAVHHLTLLRCPDSDGSNEDAAVLNSAPRGCDKPFHSLLIGRKGLSQHGDGFLVGPASGLPLLVLQAHYRDAFNASDFSRMDLVLQPHNPRARANSADGSAYWAGTLQMVQMYHFAVATPRLVTAAPSGGSGAVRASYAHACKSRARVAYVAAHGHELCEGVAWRIERPDAPSVTGHVSELSTIEPLLTRAPADTFVSPGATVSFECRYRSNRSATTHLGLSWRDEMCELWLVLKLEEEVRPGALRDDQAAAADAAAPLNGSCLVPDLARMEVEAASVAQRRRKYPLLTELLQRWRCAGGWCLH